VPRRVAGAARVPFARSTDVSARRGSRKDTAVSSISPTRSHLQMKDEATTSGSCRCPGPTVQQALSHPVTADLCAASSPWGSLAAYPIFLPAGERSVHDDCSGRTRVEQHDEEGWRSLRATGLGDGL